MNWIRRRREELNISQAELTRRLQLEGANISASSVSHWENERYNPPLENDEFRQALAKALELDVTDMLNRAGYEVTSRHSKEGERAAHIVDKMPADMRERAIRILEALL